MSAASGSNTTGSGSAVSASGSAVSGSGSAVSGSGSGKFSGSATSASGSTTSASGSASVSSWARGGVEATGVEAAWLAEVDSASAGPGNSTTCLLYTSDAADDLLCVDLGG